MKRPAWRILQGHITYQDIIALSETYQTGRAVEIYDRAIGLTELGIHVILPSPGEIGVQVLWHIRSDPCLGHVHKGSAAAIDHASTDNGYVSHTLCSDQRQPMAANTIVSDVLAAFEHSTGMQEERDIPC